MVKMSVENLIKINLLYNDATVLQIHKYNDFVVISFFDALGEVDSTVLTQREYELLRMNFYAKTLDEIIDLALDGDQDMKVTITPSIQNFPVFIEFNHCEFFCDLQEYRYILKQINKNHNDVTCT
ncbi:hypothetical protein SAMN05421676_10222 [Salinibacillus kushneri]|uniref:Uncharacterized protein n=1 Tax=Salinibacillus kushneri TaxID=237682 RepID=A0A1I0A3I9_9BACI|nr:hypothetical protein [Salinibacillus kushneri]SES88670.1 hypothetical protein SAMN05421676_10222 [Salinibacillus kushneri]